jgi:6-hydroxynicotinate 3-monooxygenase
MHRSDLHAAIASTVPNDIFNLNRKLVGLEQTKSGVTLIFEDGGRTQVDAVIGADGVHSVVREILLGPERPRFTGRVAYRTTYPAARLGDLKLDDNCKWWGPDRHIVIYGNRSTAAPNSGSLSRSFRAKTSTSLSLRRLSALTRTASLSPIFR